MWYENIEGFIRTSQWRKAYFCAQNLVSARQNGHIPSLDPVPGDTVLRMIWLLLGALKRAVKGLPGTE